MASPRKGRLDLCLPVMSEASAPRGSIETLFPFTSRFIESTANLVHYVDEGEGPPIVFLHGNPTWSFVYRDVIGRTTRELPLLAVDYPGFGLSGAREGYGSLPEEHARAVVGFLDALEPGRRDPRRPGLGWTDRACGPHSSVRPGSAAS